MVLFVSGKAFKSIFLAALKMGCDCVCLAKAMLPQQALPRILKLELSKGICTSLYAWRPIQDSEETVPTYYTLPPFL